MKVCMFWPTSVLLQIPTVTMLCSAESMHVIFLPLVLKGHLHAFFPWHRKLQLDKDLCCF